MWDLSRCRWGDGSRLINILYFLIKLDDVLIGNKMNAKVSFLIAAYNEEAYIEECVRSCLSQQGGEIEVCVVDDGSHDQTFSILQRLAADPRVLIKRLSTNSGKVAAFNAAYEMATGEYLALLGADDVNHPERVSASIRAVERFGADLVYGDYYVCDSGLRPQGVKKVASAVSLEELIFNNRLSGGTFLFGRPLAGKIFPIPERLRFEDWWIGFVALLGSKVVKIEEPLIYYRHHGGNDSLAKAGESLKARDFARHFDYYDAFAEHLIRNGGFEKSLARRIEESRLFKSLYIERNFIGRFRLARGFLAKFGAPRTMVGIAALLINAPFGSYIFDLALRLKERKNTKFEGESSDGRVSVLGVPFDNVSMGELVTIVDEAVKKGERTALALSNPEFVVAAQRNLALKRYLNDFVNINVADGVGVLWAARLFGQPLKERVTGTDFVPALYQLAGKRGYKVYFLGGRPGVAVKAKERLTSLFGVDVVGGCRDGYFGNLEDNDVVRDVNESGAQILMVCLGNPKQEDWIERNWRELKVAVVFGNGGALDFWAGEVSRAPVWLQNIGFEWLYRLGQDFSWTRVKRQSRLFEYVYLVLKARLVGLRRY